MIDNENWVNCSWKEKKAGKLYQCTAKATMTVELCGQLIPVCSYHSKRIDRLGKMKENYVDQIQKLQEQQQDIIDLISEVK